MKKAIKKILCAVTATAMIFGATLLNTSAATSFNSRSDFIWGVNGHNQTYKSYPARTLEQQIKLAAELGVKYYRFNYNPKSSNDFTYLDNVVKTADRYGLKLMLVCDDRSMEASTAATMFANIAKRYANTIPYIQVYNEMDVYFMTGSVTGGGNGDTATGYDTARMAEMLPKFKASIDAIRANAPNMKVVINISYRHTYLFTWLRANGVNWDITGVDWYKNMGFETGFITGGYDYIIPRLEAFGKDIMICETNIWPSTASNSDSYYEDVEYLPGSMNYVYTKYPSVKGMFFYELLDEPAYQMQSGSYDPESHFGLIEVSSRDFSIGNVKPVYTAIQKLLGGGAVTPKPVDTTTSSNNSTVASSSQSNPSSTPSSTSQVESTVSETESTTSEAVSSDTSASEDDNSLKEDSSKDTVSDDDSKASSGKAGPIIIISVIILVLAGGVAGFFIWQHNKKKLSDTDSTETDNDDIAENSENSDSDK